MSGGARTEPERAARPGGVIGVGIGLLALVGLALALANAAFGGRGPSDAELLEELLPAPRPLGLELVSGATLPSGERLLRLAPAGDAGPAEVVLVRHGSPEAVEGLFRVEGEEGEDVDARIADWNRDPDFAFHAETRRGELAWDGWRAPFRVTRAFEEGGGWREATTVNVTTRARALALHVLWPPETEASQAPVRAILRGLALDAGGA